MTKIEFIPHPEILYYYFGILNGEKVYKVFRGIKSNVWIAIYYFSLKSVFPKNQIFQTKEDIFRALNERVENINNEKNN